MPVFPGMDHRAEHRILDRRTRVGEGAVVGEQVGVAEHLGELVLVGGVVLLEDQSGVAAELPRGAPDPFALGAGHDELLTVAVDLAHPERARDLPPHPPVSHVHVALLESVGPGEHEQYRVPLRVEAVDAVRSGRPPQLGLVALQRGMEDPDIVEHELIDRHLPTPRGRSPAIGGPPSP
ncbi:MAG TPA: hypothetical protein VFW65_40305 [Pseudonocardiaceae bacterium]|nr:hypothetical protein [Pseudonocardiaceae bacterium]